MPVVGNSQQYQIIDYYYELFHLGRSQETTVRLRPTPVVRRAETTPLPPRPPSTVGPTTTSTQPTTTTTLRSILIPESALRREPDVLQTEGESDPQDPSRRVVVSIQDCKTE